MIIVLRFGLEFFSVYWLVLVHIILYDTFLNEEWCVTEKIVSTDMFSMCLGSSEMKHMRLGLTGMR